MFGLNWTPGIGDPTVTGWLTVVAYFASAWMCLRAFMAEKSGPPRPYLDTIKSLLRVFRKQWQNPPLPAKRSAIWLGLAIALLLLGVNKQLDIQTLFTEIGRYIVGSGGLYHQRRLLQLVFIVGIAWGSLIVLRRLLALASGPLRDFRLPFFGFTIIVAYVLIRAASFHHIDALIGNVSFGSYVNFVFECTGIVIILASASLRISRRKSEDQGKTR